MIRWVRVRCTQCGDRTFDLYGLSPMCPDCRVVGDDGKPLGWEDGRPTEYVDIVGGTQTDPGDTELDDAIEIIIADYIPDTLLRVQLTKRILAEVLRRTSIDDPYARPVR